MHTSDRWESVVSISIKSFLETDVEMDSAELPGVMINKVQHNVISSPNFYAILMLMAQCVQGMLQKYPQAPESAEEDYSAYLVHLRNVLHNAIEARCYLNKQAILEISQPMGASWEKFDKAHSELYNALWSMVTIYHTKHPSVIRCSHELVKIPSTIITMIVTMQLYRHHTPRSTLFPITLDRSATIKENETIERCASAMRIFHDAIHLVPKYTLHAKKLLPCTLVYENLLSTTALTSRTVSLVSRFTPLRHRGCVRNCLIEEFRLLMPTIELMIKHLDPITKTFCEIPICRAKDLVLTEAEAFATHTCLENDNPDAEHRITLTRFFAAFIPLYKLHIWSQSHDNKHQTKISNSVADCLNMLKKAIELQNASREKGRLNEMTKTQEYKDIVQDFQKYLDELPGLILEHKSYSGPGPKCTQSISDAYISMLWIPEYMEQLLNVQLPLEGQETPQHHVCALSVKPGTSKAQDIN